MNTVTVRINGEKLRKIRERAGLSTTQVAGAIGVHERTYVRIENDGDPRASELFAICVAIGLPPDQMHTLIVTK